MSGIVFDISEKKVNDENGHQYGDMVLRKIADTIATSIRDEDYAGRYGGEEFLVVLPDTSKSTAIAVAERVRQAVEIIELPHKGPTTISGGVGVLCGESLTELIEKADKKLYEAKDNGRNRIEV